MCSQILRCVLEARIQTHPTIGQQHWMKYGTNTDLTVFELGSPRGAVVWHVILGAHTVDTKEHFETYLNGPNPESFEDWIMILSMFNDID